MLDKAKELQQVIKEKYGVDAAIQVFVHSHNGLPQDHQAAEFFANSVLIENGFTPVPKEGEKGSKWVEGMQERINVTFFLPDK